MAVGARLPLICFCLLAVVLACAAAPNICREDNSAFVRWNDSQSTPQFTYTGYPEAPMSWVEIEKPAGPPHCWPCRVKNGSVTPPGHVGPLFGYSNDGQLPDVGNYFCEYGNGGKTTPTGPINGTEGGAWASQSEFLVKVPGADYFWARYDYDNPPGHFVSAGKHNGSDRVICAAIPTRLLGDRWKHYYIIGTAAMGNPQYPRGDEGFCFAAHGGVQAPYRHNFAGYNDEVMFLYMPLTHVCTDPPVPAPPKNHGPPFYIYDTGNSYSDIVVTDPGTIQYLSITVQLQHAKLDHIVMDLIPLTAPAKSIRLYGGSGCDSAFSVEARTVTFSRSGLGNFGTSCPTPVFAEFLPSSGPGSLLSLSGMSFAGTWRLQVSKNYGSWYSGRVLSWSLQAELLQCPDSPANSTAMAGAAPPALDASYNDAERLTFSVSSAQYMSGFFGYLRRVTLEVGTTPSASLACTAGPLSGPVAVSGESCSFIVTVSDTWKQLRECGWTTAPEANGRTNVSTTVRVSWTEKVSTGPTAGSERTSSYEQDVSFSFPTAGLAESDATVDADSGQDTFSIDQFTYSTETGQRVLTVVWSILNKYPFVYDWQPNAMVFPQVGMSFLGRSGWSASPEGCSGAGSSGWTTCKQTETLTILLPDDMCSVAGTYRFTFSTRCVDDCGSGTFTADVTAPELPVCTETLDKVVTGVTNSLTSASSGTVNMGSRVQFDLVISSANKLIWSYNIRDVYVASLAARHASDGYRNRSLRADGVTQSLGTVLNLNTGSQSFSGTHTAGGEGNSSFSDTIGFDTKIGAPETGLIAPSDVGGENPFKVRIGISLAFDSSTPLAGRRRRLKYATIEAEAELAGHALARRAAPANTTVSGRIRQGQNEYAEAVFNVSGGSSASSAIPVGAIAGVAVAGAALVAGIAAVVVLGRRRKARMEREAQASGEAEAAYKVKDVEV
ncbi:hypothetical protein DFJ74DRAFT_650100, partial [Hyaloraphidium curvatum]